LNPNLEPKTLIPVSRRVMNFGEEFAIGRVLSVAAAGEAQAHPSVRWGGFPGRRSHSSKTYGALGLISTVRIGAGAWRKWAHTRQSGDTDQARTQIHGAQKRTQERKEKTEEAFRKGTAGRSQRKKVWLTSESTIHRWRARLRSTPLRSARRALLERKNLTEKSRPS